MKLRSTIKKIDKSLKRLFRAVKGGFISKSQRHYHRKKRCTRCTKKH